MVRFEACYAVSPELEEFAEEFFDVVATDYMDDGLEQMVGYMRADAEENEMLAAAHNAGVVLPAYQIECVSSADWLTENVIKFAPVDAGEFLVYGIHETDVQTNGKIGIRVYAATAFGSEHQTTRSCLLALSDIHKLVGAQKNVLDVGTGSGVLALAAAKLWSDARITAVDIDDESVIVAKKNAEDNKVSQQISVAYSDGYGSELVRQRAPYDVIFANILARPLIAMAADMAQHLRVGGFAVISGFIDEQVDWVVGEHQKYGLTPIKTYELDRWRTVLLQKGE